MSSDLDLFRLGRRNVVRRIKDLERKVRRKSAIGTVTSTAQKTATGEKLARTDSPDTFGFYEDNSPMTIPSRPNLIKNGSFEYFQLGETPTPAYGWSDSQVVEPDAGDALDGNTCILLESGGSYQTTNQTCSHLTGYPAGSWAFSVWTKNVGSVAASMIFEMNTLTAGSTGIFYRVDAQGNTVEDDQLPADGEWYRFYTQMVSTAPVDVFGVNISTNSSSVICDCAQLEYEQGATTFLTPTPWTPDAFANPTILRELRADNIIAGTLKVGGSDSDNPVIEAYDGSDVLVARLGAPSGGYRGLEVFGAAGIKVQSGGSIEAGATTIANDGVRMEVEEDFASERAVEFVDGAGAVVGGLYGSAGNPGGFPYKAFRLSSDYADPNNVSSLTFAVDEYSGGQNAVVEIGVNSQTSAASANTAYLHDSATNQVIVHSYADGDFAAAAVPRMQLNASESAGTTTGTAKLSVENGAEKIGVFVTGTNSGSTLEGGYDLVGTSKVNGFTKTWPATNGTVSHGAGTVGGSSTNSATLENHTHAVEAYDNPGTTADRIIKTGTSGAVTLASATVSGLLTTGSFKIGTTTYTAGVGGVTGPIAQGAGTVGAGTTNNTGVVNHTHAVTTTTSGLASTIVATTSGGDIAARRGLFSQGSQLNYGTSYPSSPVAGLQYLRTDKQSLMYNTGSRWESVNPIPVEFGLDLRYVGALNPASFSSTATPVAVGHVLSNLGNVEFQTNSHLVITNNGANDDASNYWNVYVAFGDNNGGSLLTSYLGDPVETNATALKTAGNTAGVAVSKSLASAVTLNSSTNGGKAQIMVEKIGSPTSTLTIRGAIFYKYIN